MATIRDICRYADSLFDGCRPPEDFSNNGLQVEVGTECTCIAFAVDACLETIEKAHAAGAQLLMVHHGISWGSGFRRCVGMDGKRFAAMYSKGVSLYACHLPLDAHPEIGNNAVLARRLGLKNMEPFAPYKGVPLGVSCHFAEPVSLSALVARVQEQVNPLCRLLDFSGGVAHRIGIVSGSSGGVLPACIEAGVDCLLTGEFAHSSYYTAKENGVSVIMAGHYATEDTGIRELMAKIGQAFEIKTCFIEAPTGL